MSPVSCTLRPAHTSSVTVSDTPCNRQSDPFWHSQFRVAMRQVPLECDINIAVHGCSGFATSTHKGQFMAMLISRSRDTYLIPFRQLFVLLSLSMLLQTSWSASDSKKSGQSRHWALPCSSSQTPSMI